MLAPCWLAPGMTVSGGQIPATRCEIDHPFKLIVHPYGGKMRNTIGVFLLLLLMLPQLALADAASHRRLAEELLELHNAKAQVEQIAGQMQMMILSQFDALETPPESQEETKALQELTAEMLGQEFSWEILKEEYLDLYVTTFTEEELQGIIDFTKGPIGRKLQEVSPTLVQKSREIGQQHAENAMTRVQQAMEQFMADQAKKEAGSPAAAPAK